MEADASVEALAVLFAQHPAWLQAATHLSEHAVSDVYFSHRPGEVYHLERRGGRTRLLEGSCGAPDFVFRFTPRSIEELSQVEGGIGDFAVALFTRILEEDPDRKVGFRIAAGFARLARRGYVGLLLAAGPKVLTFGASHGVQTLAGLQRFVRDLRSRGKEDWEQG